MGKKLKRKTRNNPETNKAFSRRKSCNTIETPGNTQEAEKKEGATSTATISSHDIFSSIFGADLNDSDQNTSTEGGGVYDLFSSSKAHQLQHASSERIVKNKKNLKNTNDGDDDKGDRGGSDVPFECLELGHSNRQKTIDRRRKRNGLKDSILTINSISVTLPTVDNKADNEKGKTEVEVDEDDLQRGIMRLFTNQADAVMRDKGVLILNSPGKHSSVRLFDDSLLNCLSEKAKMIEIEVCNRLEKEGKIWQAKDHGEVTGQENDKLEQNNAFQYHEVASRCLGRLDIRYAMDQPPFSYQDVVNNSYLKPIIRSLLGKSAKLVYTGLILSFPNSRDQPWHQDGEALFEEHDGISSEMHLPPYALNVFIPLHDISEELGPTEFFVGSHYDTIAKEIMQPKSTTTKFARSPVGPLIKCGDVLMYDYRICHRGTSNLSIDRTRPILYLMYARPWFCEHLNFGQDRLFSSP